MGFYTHLIKPTSFRKWDEVAVPHPEVLSCRQYWLISLITIPKQDRGKGKAKKYITEFCGKKKGKIFISLHNDPKSDLNGWVLQGLLKRLGFVHYSKDKKIIEMVRP